MQELEDGPSHGLPALRQGLDEGLRRELAPQARGAQGGRELVLLERVGPHEALHDPTREALGIGGLAIGRLLLGRSRRGGLLGRREGRQRQRQQGRCRGSMEAWRGGTHAMKAGLPDQGS